MKKQWNVINFDFWQRDQDRLHYLTLSINEYSEGPIVLEMFNGEEGASEWMKPEAARELANKLIEAADACDKAGKYK